MEGDAFLQKAAESVASAEDDHSKGRYNSCAGSTYYAAFQAAVAALMREGIRPRGGEWTHAFVRSQFSGRLVYRRKLYDREFRSLLMQAFDRRVVADYTTTAVKRQDVDRLLDQTVRLVAGVREQIDGNR